MPRSQAALSFSTGASATLALALALPACGKKDDPAPTPVAVAPAPPDAKAADGPAEADPHGPGGPSMGNDTRGTRAAKGIMEMTIDGTPQRIEFLPFGRNSAVWAPDTKVARINLGGSESDKGLPALSMVLLGHKLDELELPRTFTSVPNARGASQELFRMTWQVGEKRLYRSVDGDTANKLTLEEYKDGRLKGSFEGTLVFGNAKAEKPLQVQGSFDVALRLNGVEPNRVAAQGG
jgi:hypothetical protein